MPTGLTKEELNALIEVGKTVNAHLDLDTVLESVMSVTTEVMKVEASSLVLVDDETGDLLFHVARGAQAEAVKPIRMKWGEGVVGWVVESGKPAIVNDVANDKRFYKAMDESSGFQTRSILCVPLVTGDRRSGAIEVLNKLGGEDFDEHDLLLCEAVASQAAIAVENARLHRQMLKTERLAAIGQTVAGTAHCIKNLLNGIHGGSYMIDRALVKDDRALLTRGWGMVKKNNGFLQELVLDMLTYSKEREPEYELADVNAINQAVCELMAQKAQDKGVTIRWEPNPHLSQVVLDSKGISPATRGTWMCARRYSTATSSTSGFQTTAPESPKKTKTNCSRCFSARRDRKARDWASR